jgi:hypothetical protein
MAKRARLSDNGDDAQLPVAGPSKLPRESAGSDGSGSEDGRLEDLDDSEDDLSGLEMQAGSDEDEDDEGSDDDMNDIIAANEDAQSKQKKSMLEPIFKV